MSDIRFEWDRAKAEANRRKHGIPFEAAVAVFDDPNQISEPDRVEDGEQRWWTIGLVEGFVLLFVAHTWREAEEVEIVRIISARRATKAERKRYAEG